MATDPDAGSGEDANSTCETNPECTPGQEDTERCNDAAKQRARTCLDDCTWGGWSDCEQVGVCQPDTKEICGNCGTSTCDQNGQYGPCLNEGVCTADATELQTCENDGAQSRICTENCEWGTWSECTLTCIPDQVQKADCTTEQGKPGTRQRTCTDAQTWGEWTACTGCQDEYIPSSLNSCKDFTAAEGIRELCLNIEQIQDAEWKWQVCKKTNGSPAKFENKIKIELYDANYMSQGVWDIYEDTPNNDCTPWRTVDLGYVNGYGAVNGAGLSTHIYSPNTCSQTSCTYNTGVNITVRLECL